MSEWSAVVGCLVMIAGSMIGCTWKIARVIYGVRDEVSKLRKEMNTIEVTWLERYGKMDRKIAVITERLRATDERCME